MAARLTEKQKKQIVADRINGMSFRKLADKYKVSTKTIQRTVKADEKVTQIATQKKEQQIQDMLAYMDAQKGEAQKLLTSIIEALSDPEKLARANVRDLATAYGIIADKFIAAAPKESEEVLQKAREILGAINGVIK